MARGKNKHVDKAGSRRGKNKVLMKKGRPKLSTEQEENAAFALFDQSIPGSSSSRYNIKIFQLSSVSSLLYLII